MDGERRHSVGVRKGLDRGLAFRAVVNVRLGVFEALLGVDDLSQVDRNRPTWTGWSSRLRI